MIGGVKLGTFGSVYVPGTLNLKEYYYYIKTDGKVTWLPWADHTETNCSTLNSWIINNLDILYNTSNLSIFTKNSPTGKMNLGEVMTYRSNIINLDVSRFNTNLINNMVALFTNFNKITELNLKNFNTKNVNCMYAMFQFCSNIKELDLSNFDMSNVDLMAQMFQYCDSLKTVNLPELNCPNLNNISQIFHNCHNLTNFTLNITKSSKLIYMNYAFDNCYNLTSIDDKLKIVKTASIRDMDYLCRNCTSLKSFNFSKYNCSNVYDVDGIFADCSNITDINMSMIPLRGNYSTAFRNCRSLINLTLNKSGSKLASSYRLLNAFLNCNKLSSASLNDIANIIPNYSATYHSSNNICKYMGLMTNNYDIRANLTSAINKKITDKGWIL